jgi:hypothetical protein
MAEPTHIELQKALGAVCKVVGQIPYFHIYEQSLSDVFDVSSRVGESLQAMTHNAALDSTLLNIRAFNEFFKERARADDIRAHHFPALPLRPFLSSEQESEIHKHLAHLTWTRANIDAKPWTIDGLMAIALKHRMEFLDSIDRRFQFSDETARAEVRGVRDASRMIIESLFRQQKSN